MTQIPFNIDGKCMHCAEKITTFGCPRCTSSQTTCSCGALIRCGCGMIFEHKHCPNVLFTDHLRIFSKIVSTGVTVLPGQQSLLFPDFINTTIPKIPMNADPISPSINT
jgi:hypothetical protein